LHQDFPLQHFFFFFFGCRALHNFCLKRP
jgi:hypothetical protein